MGASPSKLAGCVRSPHPKGVRDVHAHACRYVNRQALYIIIVHYILSWRSLAASAVTSSFGKVSEGGK